MLEEVTEYVKSIREMFTKYPHAVPAFLKFYFNEFQEECPDLKGKSIAQIIKGKKSLELAIDYIERSDDIWDFIERFEDDIKGDYDIIEWGETSEGGDFKISLLNVGIEDKEAFLDFIAKSYKSLKDKPSIIDIINRLTVTEL